VLACTPHPGLGTVVYRHVQIDLATCKQQAAPTAHPVSDGLTVRARHGSQVLLFKGKVVLIVHERYGKDTPEGVPGPIVRIGLSPDRRWALYAIDPMGSASIAADGLPVRAIRVTGGRSYPVASGLWADDYRAWCGGRLVVTAGLDRIATHNKRLIVTGPPGWKPHRVVSRPRMSFGSLVCDGSNGIVVQGQPSNTDANFFHTHWSLYRVGLDGSMSRLTSPPAGHADESPKVAGGVVYFVRSTHGNGELYALQNGKVVGPLLSLGYSLGYYGHQAWPYSVTR
jgi:hypothetical protein